MVSRKQSYHSIQRQSRCKDHKYVLDTISAAGMDETYGTYVDDACFDVLTFMTMMMLIMILMMILTMILMMILMMMLMMIRESVSNQGSMIKDLVRAPMSILVYWYTLT